MNFIDIEAGIGGMTQGMRQAGFTPVMAFAQGFDAEAYSANFKIPVRPFSSLGTLQSRDLPRCEIVCGSFPGRRRDMVGAFALYLEKVICITFPRAVFLELPEKTGKDIEDIKDRMNGYTCWQEKIWWYEYGIPRHVARNYVVAFRKDVRLKFSAFPFPETTLPREQLGNKGLADFDEMILTMPLEYGKSLMGFPKEYMLPFDEARARKFLIKASSPTIIQTIASELKDWISY